MAKNIRVFLKTRQHLLADMTEEAVPDILPDTSETEFETEFESVGTLCRRNGVFTVEYIENPATGMPGENTKITFSEAEPDRVTVTRCGMIASTLVFKPGLRYISVYDTEFGSFEMGVVTQSVANTVGLSGGAITAEYMLELHGTAMENTCLQITVKCEDGDTLL